MNKKINLVCTFENINNTHKPIVKTFSGVCLADASKLVIEFQKSHPEQILSEMRKIVTAAC